eukprot:CAMPEP_0185568458 /NCGR_PEP_ID=MMETSP0434-20130131/1419_1 /TAXON_ID=626734 ORGANISM="Favella taraikaensis, Strain Fe Narragansett Bay" /NCGR_SAMPLE_ID=MMETSP0434 /ASSEMBLY_ACC=CAM_ASM_000379 /LENGTH=42 /DNA_ID= /DNA_START= /DNA_END= /DNA_ORIENTATION=
MVVWYAMGLGYRFRESGKYASGDIVPSGMSKDDWIAEITQEG